jgi:lipoprotein NlpD
MTRLRRAACMALLGIAGCSTHPAPISERGAAPEGVSPTVTSAAVSPTTGLPVTASPSPTPAFKGGYYTVRRGDTLAVVAFLCGCDMRELATWNHITPPYVIQIGQRLRLSPPVGEPSSPLVSAPRDDLTPTVPAAPAMPVETGEWQWPVSGRVLNGFAADANARKGLDLGGREGEPVKAAAGGRVVYAGNGLLGYGYLVIIQHDERLLSAYGYNRKLSVKEGQIVRAGQTVAEMGTDGSARPMLHFEVRRDGKPVDPRGHLPARR